MGILVRLLDDLGARLVLALLSRPAASRTYASYHRQLPRAGVLDFARRRPAWGRRAPDPDARDCAGAVGNCDCAGAGKGSGGAGISRARTDRMRPGAQPAVRFNPAS